MLFLIFFFLEIILLFFLSKLLTKSLSRVFLNITKSQTATINLLSFLFLPGVIVHELSHLLMAGILFVPTGEIEFVPKLIDGGVKLGSVAIAKTDPIRRAIIGFAPVVVGLSIILGLFYLHPLSSFWGGASATTPESVFGRFWTSQNDGALAKLLLSAISFYLLFAIANTMFSSRKDMEGTIELLIVLGIISAAFYIMGFRWHLSIPNAFVDKTVDIIKTLDLFLLWPLAIDFVAVGIIKSLNRV